MVTASAVIEWLSSAFIDLANSVVDLFYQSMMKDRLDSRRLSLSLSLIRIAVNEDCIMCTVGFNQCPDVQVRYYTHSFDYIDMQRAPSTMTSMCTATLTDAHFFRTKAN